MEITYVSATTFTVTIGAAVITTSYGVDEVLFCVMVVETNQVEDNKYNFNL